MHFRCRRSDHCRRLHCIDTRQTRLRHRAIVARAAYQDVGPGAAGQNIVGRRPVSLSV
jgi:hypothetical protein